MASAPLRRDRLAALLEERILSGEYPVGSLLPSERKLAESLGVSRTALREGMRVLAERGLISVEQGRGAVVLAVDAAATASAMTDALRRRSVTARDVVSGRLMLETETARLAAEHRSGPDLEEMDIALVQLGDSTSILQKVKADLAFHRAVARASGNIVLETMFHAISELSAEMMLRSLSDHTIAAEGLPQHHEIRDAIAEGDGARASTLMHEHIQLAMTHYGPALDQPLDNMADRELVRLLGGHSSVA